MNYHKKLIEVALPLEAINRACITEKAPRPGHPATLHLWWARRPLAACRAVLFGQLIDDPSGHPDKFPTEEAQERERGRLFKLLDEFVTHDGSNNETLVAAVRAELLKSRNLPPVFDPFCGGGSIPLEAQRLGLTAYGADLNPVAVLITKALVEIPPKFSGQPPVHPRSSNLLERKWTRAQGLAEDVQYYANWMLKEAQVQLGSTYPQIEITKDMAAERRDLLHQVGNKLTVIAWLWARTIRCPNPACGGEIPLIGSYWLCQKKDKKAWLGPLVDRKEKTIKFIPRVGKGGEPSETQKVGGRSGGCRCFFCDEVADADYMESEGKSGHFGTRLITIVADGPSGRLYLPATAEHETIAKSTSPGWKPDYPLPPYSQALPTARYGAVSFADLFTTRQLATLETFSRLVRQARDLVLQDAIKSGLPNDAQPLSEGGKQSAAYADAVATYLGLIVGRQANRSSSFCFWDSGSEKVQQPFAQQGINKTWDFCEGNPLSGASGSWKKQVEYAAKVLERCPPSCVAAHVSQRDAAAPNLDLHNVLVCCDPPYYSNIGYADLSDFFYIWHRRALQAIYPTLFSTVLTPKTQELVAAPYRFDKDKEKARKFFVDGLTKAFGNLRELQNADYPLAVFYSFKQAESKGNGEVVSTGWDVMLQALLSAGFSVTGTWPMHTENVAALKKEKAALATSVVLACRPRPVDAPLSTRKELLTLLKAELPVAMRKLQQANIAPVDLAQAAIGPGMAIYSRYSKVLEADGTTMTVRTAMALINQALDEILAEQESEFDAETRWTLAWFEQYGMEEAASGIAETLARAKNTAINVLVDAGILVTKAGKVRLRKRDELHEDWDPTRDRRRLTVWEIAQHLIRALEHDGEVGAASLLRKLGGLGDVARDLAYRLYTLCDRKKWTQESLAYNGLVTAWPEIAHLAQSPDPIEQVKLNL
jgi:putative DNA methylase